jgi:DNA modification methylase
MEKVQIGEATIYQGDCLAVLPTFAADSVDSVVSDPPYGLEFMGKQWDHGVPGEPFWQAVLRVLKPGGYMLAMGGSRTYHRLACAVEEVRDCLMWIYGSGFPKGKGCLKPAYEPILLCRKPGAKVLPLGIDACRVETGDSLGRPACYYRNGNVKGHMEERPWMQRRKDAGEPVRPATEGHTAGRWPANVLHDGSDEVMEAFPAESSITGKRSARSRAASVAGTVWLTDNHESQEYTDSGSPARFFYCAKASRSERNEGLDGMPLRELHHYADDVTPRRNGAASGGALTNGTGKVTPQRNHHPTVKPLALMRWLVRLVTPPGGVVLDPFLGSGTTAKAAAQEGFRCIGIEREPEYFQIAQKRIESAYADSPLLQGGAA